MDGRDFGEMRPTSIQSDAGGVMARRTVDRLIGAEQEALAERTVKVT